jgi:hypothetical protein
MRGTCLCGDVTWQAEGELSLISHCHCSRCRKAHGTAYATWAAAPEHGFALGGTPARFESSPGFFRCFCSHCGSVTPGDAAGEQRFVPLGSAEPAPAVRAEAHIFAASKAPWFALRDALPRFDAYPPGWDAPALADRAPPARADGVVRGSCLCGGIAFEIARGDAPLARFCHCSRCRKARAAAFASNWFVPLAQLRFVRGAEKLVSYKLPEAERFTQSFCGACGGKLPRVDPARGMAVVPLGALDDDPGVRPGAHIFVGSKAPWDEIADDLPKHVELPA